MSSNERGLSEFPVDFVRIDAFYDAVRSIVLKLPIVLLLVVGQRVLPWLHPIMS
jgi:hypothetical protein